MFCGFISKAQFVNIPDTNFVTYLQQNFPLAMNGNLMDTSHVSILNAKSVYCSGLAITNLEGIQYFKSLDSLDCSSNSSFPTYQFIYPILPDSLDFFNCSLNNLDSLYNLPSGLRTLWCFQNSLTSLPVLPNGLEMLICSRNYISSISSLPSSLKYLDFGSNTISISPTLPSSLCTLFCNNNNLNALPILPANLKKINCSKNQITSVPALPNSLTEFLFYDNLIASLPTLPDSLKVLFGYNNLLTSLPVLNDSLETLICSINKLTSIPSLPPRLTTLYCDSNQITNLPSLPNSLAYLNCSSNNLSNLPTLPDNLWGFVCVKNPNLSCLPPIKKDTLIELFVHQGTNIKCLPKVLYSYGYSQTSFNYLYDSTKYLPVCTPTSGCPIAYNILGNVHLDTSNSNCLADSINNGQKLKGVKVMHSINGNLVYQMYSSINGFFSFDAQVSDTSTTSIDTVGMPFYVTCPASNQRKNILTTSDSVFLNQDFGIKCTGIADVGAEMIIANFRNSIARPVIIKAGDLSNKYNLRCASGKSGNVTITINGDASYSGPFINALTPSVSGKVLTYSIADFGLVNTDSAFNFNVLTDTNAVLGSSICIKIIVQQNSIDYNPSNDSLLYCGLVSNSFDPNIKEVYPQDYVQPNEWLTYTIHFQNTGNDTAYKIIIRDTLDANLDFGSFTFLGSSYPAEVSLKSNAILFNFKDINLLDSFHNEPLSHGWLQYKIKSKANIPINCNIKNTASIYFDNNTPIVTNTTQNIFAPLLIKNNLNLNQINVYPNPTYDELTIELSNSVKPEPILITNMYGQVVLEKSIINKLTVKTLDWSKGVYIVKVGGVCVKVLVK
jgi:uncharacterized repeat protein (TIGR01451 family)